MNKTDLVAKLLANENLTVLQEPVRTASFDIVNRVLRLPQWKDMTQDLIDMLVGHEVGHALYTTEEAYFKNNPYKDVKHFAGYMNVLEDVRIEKLMKRRYPGLRKSFNLGYKELNDRDFFGVANGFKDMLLIDKINLYFKAGYSCGVVFNAEEKAFVRRAEETETCDDVIKLAKEIYDYSKQAMDKKIEEMQAQSDMHGDQGDEEDESQDQMEEFVDADSIDTEQQDDVDMDGQANSTTANDDTQFGDEEDALESKTEKSLRNKIDELADTSVKYEYLTIPQFKQDPIVTYHEVFDEAQRQDDQTKSYNPTYHGIVRPDDVEYAEQFKQSTKGIVNYLIKEFEMRKSAQNYKRAKVAKSGSLDGRKLYAYKLNDDIFKQVMTIPNGKSHGMIFLLDWSASMDAVLRSTIEQVISLAMFCKGAQIPYQVFAFTTAWDGAYDRDLKVTSEKEIDINGMKLMELFSSKMTTSEFNKMITLTLAKNFSWSGNFRTSGTPLNAALAYMHNYIPKFIKANNVEKMTLITLSDGEGDPLRSGNGQIRMMSIKNEQNDWIATKPFINDPVTKKSYTLEDSCEQTKSLLRLLKDKYSITTLGFYVTKMSYRYLGAAIYAHHGRGTPTALKIEEMKQALRRDGFTTLDNSGRDELFIISDASTKIKAEEELNISNKESASRIARMLSKKLSNKKASRILLNSFIGYIA